MNKVKVLTVRFKNELDAHEIPLFRGAIVHAMKNANVLFHNHLEEGRLRYSYPLIQYKSINHKAAIICVGEGTDVIGDLFSSDHFDVLLGNKEINLEVESVRAEQCLVQLWNGSFEYHLRKWLPLNQTNYEKYCSLDSLASKYAMLERMLVGNILSFAKGIGIRFENKMECQITSADNLRIVPYKDVKMTSFDVNFKSNVSIPNYVGLGKGVSLGYGTVSRIKQRQEEEKTE